VSSDPPLLGDRTLAYHPPLAVVGPDVCELQVLLGSLGYQIVVDATYGPETADQVRRFQQHRSLRADGVFGEITFAELSRIRGILGRGSRPYYLRDSYS